MNDEFKDIINSLEQTNQSVFITGRAGTGKSTLLRQFYEKTRKKAVVLAPTGIAALNVGGQTIHSFFGFPPKLLSSVQDLPKRTAKIYRNLQVIIIDEISMVRADLLDNIDAFLKQYRGNPAPFGGVQLLFFGDMFQLPPVVPQQELEIFRQRYESPYFFSANVMKELEIESFELKKVYRQENKRFLKLLDAVRLNRAEWEDLEELNARHEPNFSSSDYYITLSARNATVNQLNEEKLKELPVNEYQYTAMTWGDFKEDFAPTDRILRLKVGAQVMFVKNDTKRRFVNGTIGKVIRLSPDMIDVEVVSPDGLKKMIEVERYEWELHKYKLSPEENIQAESVGKFQQFPLKLAWAITIHKSQGKTFDKVIIDLGAGAFEHGQTYVALSRCRTLEGIVLKQKLRPRDILTDERIVEYYQQSF